MSSKEIAELTGKQHKHVIRDIEAMISEIEKDGPDLDHQAKSKGYTIERDNRGYVKIIHLDHSHTITLITGYDARQRKKVVDRWLELEHSGNSPTTSKPKRIRKPAFDTAFTRCMNVVALLPNVDENQKVLMAARGTHTLTGINPLEVMGYAALPATTEDNYQTPTQLGKPFCLPPRRVNQILVDAGLQVHTPGSSTGSAWSMTDKGLAYGKMFDTSRRGGKGSQQQLKWKPSVAEFLRPFSQTPA
jgi:hypothetical protein